MIDRWDDAGPYLCAVLTAAIDADRLGARELLAAALLQGAAPGCCSPAKRAQAPINWFEMALAYSTQRLRGAVAALSPANDGRAWAPSPATASPTASCNTPTPPHRPFSSGQLLDRCRHTRPLHRPQHFRRGRSEPRPVPARRPTVAKRHRTRTPCRPTKLVSHLYPLHPTDPRSVGFADPDAVVELLRGCGRWGGRADPPRWPRAPPRTSTLDDLFAVAQLLNGAREVGAGEQATTLGERLPAAGMVAQFVGVGVRGERFRFGRDRDGCAVARLCWEDLQ